MHAWACLPLMGVLANQQLVQPFCSEKKSDLRTSKPMHVGLYIYAIIYAGETQKSCNFHSRNSQLKINPYSLALTHLPASRRDSSYLQVIHYVFLASAVAK